MPEQITSYLRSASGLSDSQRADLWDAYYQAQDPQSLAAALDAVDAPKSVKADLWDMKAQGVEGVAPKPPGQDIANLPPEVRERIRKHRAILAGGRSVGGQVQMPQRTPMTPQGAPRMQGGQRMSPQQEQEMLSRSGSTAATMAGMIAAPAAAARLPGIAGRIGRFAMTPGGDAAIAGSGELMRTGDAGRAAGAAASGYVGGRLFGAGGRGIIGRLLRRGGDAAPPAAAQTAGRAAGRAPTPVDLGSVNTGATPAQVPPPNVQVRAGSPAAAMQRQGHPVAPPAQVGTPNVRGNTVSMPAPQGPAPGSPAAAMQRQTSPELVRSAAPAPNAPPPGTPAAAMRRQTPIGQARSDAPMTVPRQATDSEEAARLLVSKKVLEGARRLGYSKEQTAAYQRAANAVMDAQLDGTLSFQTPSGAPSQLAKTLAEKFKDTMGLTSPYKAQKFIDGILEMAGQQTERRGLGMGIVQ